MGMKEPRGSVAKKTHNGWIYEAAYPASEQNVVLYITNKLRGKSKEELANLAIEPDRLRAFTSVYPRLYQVPVTSRERLANWVESHEAQIQTWNLGYFLHTPEEDRTHGSSLESPVFPQRQLLSTLREKTAIKITTKSSNPTKKRKCDGEAPTTTIKAFQFPAEMIEKHADELANRSQQEYLATEIKAAGRAFKALHSLITGEARDLDDGNEFKAVLEDLAERASQDLKRITKAAKTPEELQGHLEKPSVTSEEDAGPEAHVPARVPSSSGVTQPSRGGPRRASIREKALASQKGGMRTFEEKVSSGQARLSAATRGSSSFSSSSQQQSISGTVAQAPSSSSASASSAAAAAAASQEVPSLSSMTDETLLETVAAVIAWEALAEQNEQEDR
ncbi:hypothetical protein QBC38DRAFT_440364 [Podospora fimiseda]|uniref:Uncharacterized protein n=1 Tax=Podospora fimiseda TaxID=252190 RepID=A0AAN7BWK9_9PEZI|nr:hypothetical protein QBC38DRAFT_440364 [Podospora fimiseda]